MYKKLLLAFVVVFATTFSKAQSVSGKVSDEKSKTPLPGVNIYWAGTTTGSSTAADGRFTLPISDQSKLLVASMVGYSSDTIRVEGAGAEINFKLHQSVDIATVEITETQSVFSMSAASTINTEAINRGVLRKAACCNLSETFESTATVDVVMNDALTGARKIQMLGLEGVYVQNLFEGIPFTRGLGNILGFDQIPGPWINSIQLSKGIGSVAEGYESMTGQINLEFLQPCALDAVHFDVFASNQGRYESNLIWNRQIGAVWSTAIFAGVHTQQMKVDNNNDGFLDMPLREGAKVMNRWKYEGDLFRMELIGRYSIEERSAGQTGFNYDEDFGTVNSYGFGMDYEQAEILGKFGFFNPDREDQTLGITAIATYNDADTYFGFTTYDGIERTARVNMIFQSDFAPLSDHSYKAGLHFLYDAFSESLGDSAFSRTERVPGMFAEYTYERPRFTAIAGARLDFHNIYGNQFSPRVHLKYNFKELTSLRYTAGSGFRAPNAFADQLGLLASARNVVVLESPKAEESWNTGLSFLHKFEIRGREAVFNTDYFYTSFVNQLVVDRDASPQVLQFYNLDGRSFAHSFQTDFQYEVLRGLGIKLSYKFQDVQMQYETGLLEKPMIPNHRALFNAGYTTKAENWYFDITGNYYGTMRLPGTASNPESFRLGDRSESFYLFNAQITRTWKKVEVYVGAENLGNYIQENAIIDPENPFGSNFDATMIYAPLNGRMYYLGVRLNLQTKKQ